MFESPVCKTELPAELGLNNMAITYQKVVFVFITHFIIILQGHFILAGTFNEQDNYDLLPSVGTDLGVCTTIRPLVRPPLRLW